MKRTFPTVLLLAGVLALTAAMQTGADALPGDPNERFHIFGWSPESPAIGDTVQVNGRYCEPDAPGGPWEISLLEIYGGFGGDPWLWLSDGVVTEQNADGSWKGTIKVDQDIPNGPATIAVQDGRIHARCSSVESPDVILDSYFPIAFGIGGPTTTVAPSTTVAPATTAAPAPSTVGTAAASPTTAMSELPRTGSSAIPLTVTAISMIALGSVAVGYRRRLSPR